MVLNFSYDCMVQVRVARLQVEVKQAKLQRDAALHSEAGERHRQNMVLPKAMSMSFVHIFC